MSRARRRPPPPPPDDLDDDPSEAKISLVRRCVTAALVLAAAFAVGIVMAVVWQQVGGSDDSEGSAADPAPSVSATTGTQPSTVPTTAAPTGPQPVPVPADWVTYTDATQRATFSHPPGWGQRDSDTGVFFSETADTASGFGAQMIGVARTADPSAQQAVTNVQQSEFGTAALTNFTPGTPADAGDGTGAWEAAGSYDREGQRVAYLMRSVQAPGAVYVLIARGPADQMPQIETLLGVLQSSFRAT